MFDYDYTEENNMKEFILGKMEDQRNSICKRLAPIFPMYTDEICDMLAYCCIDGLTSAETLSAKYNLGLLDFYAMRQDFTRYKDEYMRDLEEQLQQDLYERSIRYA